MSWKASAFVKEIVKNITITEKLVLLVLADYHNTKDKACWPSIPTLSDECLVSERAMYNILDRLEEKGFIEIARTPGKQNLYRISGLDTPEPSSPVLINKPLQKTALTPEDTPEPPCSVIRKEPVFELEQVLSVPHSSEHKPSEKKKSDPRFQTFIKALKEGYTRRGWDFSFDARDGRHLGNLLRSRPRWELPEFSRAVRNYFESEGTVGGGLPYVYLSKLPQYLDSPLDRFNKTLKNRDVPMAGDTTYYA